MKPAERQAFRHQLYLLERAARLWGLSMTALQIETTARIFEYERIVEAARKRRRPKKFRAALAATPTKRAAVPR